MTEENKDLATLLDEAAAKASVTDVADAAGVVDSDESWQASSAVLASREELEALSSEAYSALGPLSIPAECKSCGKLTRSVCSTCHGAFCDAHASPLDSTFCDVCLSVPDAELKVMPLKDADGETHEGRDLIPGPAYATFATRISKMSQYELEAYIHKYKDLIKQAETLLDFRRVAKGMLEVEKRQREDIQRRRLRGVKVPRPQVASASATASASAPAAKPKAKASFDAATLMKMLEALKNKQKK